MAAPSRRNLTEMYSKLPADQRRKVLLVLADDWVAETSETRQRQKLLGAIEQMPAADVAIVSRRADLTAETAAEEIRHAVYGLVALGNEGQLKQLALPLTGAWASWSLKCGSDEQWIENMCSQLSLSAVGSLERMVEHMLRPAIPVSRRRAPRL